MMLILASFLISIYSTFKYLTFIQSGEKSLLVEGNTAHRYLMNCLWLIGVILFYSIYTHDFSMSYVANYSSTKEEWYYLISTFWAGQEGTFYLWLMYTALFGMFIIKKNDEFLPYVMVVLHLTILFILVILLKQSPFRPLDPEIVAGIADGRGLNPLLKNPWMVIHPPILFLGYSSVIVTSAYAIAGLWKNKLSEWMKPAMPWALFTTGVLGLGVMMGGYWAYVTLGWGGYWAWDPVENASIFPWFSIVACFHGILLYRGNKSFLKTTIFMAIIAYFLMLYGSFLTRSGVIANFSVHSFSSLGLNEYLVVFMAAFLGLAFYWFFKRWSSMESKPLEDKFNKEMMLAFVVIIFSLSTFAILAGTSIPLITLVSWIAEKQQASAQPEQYNLVFSYVAAFLGLFLGAGPAFKWKFSSTILSAKQHIISIVVGLIFFALVYMGYSNIKLQYYGVFLTVSWAIAINVQIFLDTHRSKIMRASSVSHIGFGLMLFGMMTSSALADSNRVLLVQNEAKDFKHLNITYDSFFIDKETPTTKYYRVNVVEDGEEFTIDLPTEFSDYNKSTMTKPHLVHHLTRDFYYSLVNAYEFPKGTHKVLKAGDTETISNEEFKFIGFNVLEMNPTAGIFRVQANFEYSFEGKTITSSTKFEQLNGESHSDIVEIPELKTQFKVMKVNATNRSIDFVYGSIDKPLIIEQLEIEISEKPYIVILWIGVIVLVIGVLFAANIRHKQSLNSVTKSDSKTEPVSA